MNNFLITIKIPQGLIDKVAIFLKKYEILLISLILSALSIYSFIFYYKNGLGLAYNDARSHLDIARRVVEGLKPGLAQLGSVWLPLPHILMTLTVWNDFMWHSGLAGASISMISYLVACIVILKFLKHLNVGYFAQYIGVLLFAVNLNILYLQSTAMTELLLIATMTIASYQLMLWSKTQNIVNLILSAFFVMLSTLVRYDGWFLLAWASGIVIFLTATTKDKTTNLWESIKTYYKNYSKTEGLFVLFVTLAGFGIALWLLWNLLIFKDPFYFAFGPYSAKAQQDQLEQAGSLPTKHNLNFSSLIYLYALMYNSYAALVIIGLFGAIYLFADKRIDYKVRIASSVLLAPLVFNILALYLGHSVLFVQGLSGNSWFNVRYGVMVVPAVAIFCAYLLDKLEKLRWPLFGVIFFTIVFSIYSRDAVTIDDAKVGSSQKNVSEVSGWLKEHASNEKGFVLISAASHDAIIFSSGMPMKRFIHEGTGIYWLNATALPDQWARWIIMRTHDDNDQTWRLIKNTDGFQKYNLVDHFPFADIYEIKPEFLDQLHTEALNVKQR